MCRLLLTKLWPQGHSNCGTGGRVTLPGRLGWKQKSTVTNYHQIIHIYAANCTSLFHCVVAFHIWGEWCCFSYFNYQCWSGVWTQEIFRFFKYSIRRCLFVIEFSTVRYSENIINVYERSVHKLGSHQIFNISILNEKKEVSPFKKQIISVS